MTKSEQIIFIARSIKIQHVKINNYAIDLKYMLEHNASNMEELSNIIDGLLECSGGYHKIENEILAQLSLPLAEIEEHKRDHLTFYKRMSVFKTTARNGGADIPKALLSWLNIWIEGHIRAKDMLFIESSIIKQYIQQ